MTDNNASTTSVEEKPQVLQEAPAKKPKKAKKNRAWELDALRGLAILLVAWDHLMVDIGWIFGSLWKLNGTQGMRNAVVFANDYLNGKLRHTFWPVFVFMFFIISGICTTFSRNNILRGLKLAGVALGLTAVTMALEKWGGMEDTQILFGVLHCLAVCILTYAIFELIFMGISKAINHKNDHSKVTKWLLPGFCVAIGIVILVLQSVYNPPVVDADLYNSISSPDNMFLGILVYTQEWWYITADYFPLIPFMGYFMLGAGVAPLIYPKKKSLLPRLDGPWMYPLTIPGRYSIFIYLGSQVLAIGIIALISYIKIGVLF